ncbi:unnamed protein product [Rhizophagus irregularis]|uniref:Uncharacterized protein n=1 Tax=Rhizophagus irregularis TaxID=588596 RepID=A0A2I1GU60_9GLOM|nr:hypothetical protein RhiirA4_466482 [Rhizophagus irregularis]CAB4415706.1 unnamed protein product [Rhizophagus irregularis]
MSSQNQNQLSHRIYKSTQEQEKILGGTPKQVHKINELEKVGNKVGPAAASSSQLYYVPPYHSSKEKAPSSFGGATIYNLSLEAQTHDSDGGKTFLPIPNAQVHDFAMEARGFASQNSGLLDLSDEYDGRSSSSPPFSNHYAKITSILNDPQTYDNGDGHQSDQTHDRRASATIPNPQTHDGRTSINPQTYDRWASSSSILLRYSSNYYARIPSILNGLQTLPSFPWFLNNPNETNDVSLPPIYNNSTPQQIYLHTFEPDHKPEDLDYHFVYK